MTESEWADSEDPARMLAYYQEWRGVSDRKLRLFACACCRQVWGRLTAAQKANVVFAEKEPWHQSALGSVHPEYLSQDSLTTYTGSVGDGRSINNAVLWLGAQDAAEVAMQSPAWLQRVMLFQTQASLLRDIVGSPFRQDKDQYWPRHKRAKYCTTDVLNGATAAYEDRAADGTLKAEHLLPLSDALEDAGCPVSITVRCGGCGGLGYVLDEASSEYPCLACGQGTLQRPRRGTGQLPMPHPLVAHLRSPGPHWRGCWAVDLILNKE